MTTDPLAWVRAEMDAAEKVAETAAECAWSPHWEYDYMVKEIRDLNNGGTLATIYHPEIAAHVEAHDPAAVLRRTAADRKQLELHADDGHGDCATCGINAGIVETNYMAITERGSVTHPCPTVLLIAEGWGWTEETT